jgi:NAD(P) transhydrogenase subunit alpha
VPKEIVSGERRVALVPDAVGRLTKAGAAIVVETGAGAEAYFADEAYEKAGATIVPDAATAYARADIVVKVQKPEPGEFDRLKSGVILIAFLSPFTNADLVQRLAKQGVTAMSMDAIPRTTRAQYMDALSSMATVAGYKAVLMAADHCPKFFPLLMTAAGTIAPAKALVLGAGVAGLQAIGTARRLGAVVEAFDVRPVVKEQVESLGAKFVDLSVSAEGTGGYAKELGEDENRRTREGLHPYVVKSDVVITTAAIPGRPAPRLIAEQTVREMLPGSVIVDLAAETGGNCELSAPGEGIERYGVSILAPLNVPSMMPVHASQMYSKNVQNLLDLLAPKGQLNLNLNDDIIKGMTITNRGEVIHEMTRSRLGLPPLADPNPTPDATAAAATAPPPPKPAPAASTVTAGTSPPPGA